MKLGRVTLTNTDKELLAMLSKARGCLPVAALVRMQYANTKQPEKKAATYTKRLRRLQRFGKVREVQGGWMVTTPAPTTPTNPPTLRLSA